uniref:AMP-binding protein n=1 Tax=Salmonella enterica TaxID=28901 RepID=UPI00391FB294
MRAMPDKLAIIHGEMRLSYGELDRLADVTARALIDRGTQRGDRVGLHMDRSAAAIVAMLA